MLLYSPANETWITRAWEFINFPLTVTFTRDLPISFSGLQDLADRFDLFHLRLYQRPLAAAVKEEVEAKFASSEWLNLVLGLAAACSPSRFLNAPLAAMTAESKPYQLDLARRIGFRVPRTCITNSPEAMRDFLAELGGSGIVKTVDNSICMDPNKPATQLLIFTRRILVTGVRDSDNPGRTSPVILQQEIAKSFELRVVVFGHDFRVIRIDSQKHEASRVDFRRRLADSDIYSMVDDRWTIGADCVRYCEEAGIDMGVFDFAIDQNDEPIFLECNPNGQWEGMNRSAGGDVHLVAYRYLERRLEVLESARSTHR